MLAGMKQSKEDISALRKIFIALDDDQDGYLTREEIIQGMKQVDNGLSTLWGKNPDWDTVITSIDTNRENPGPSASPDSNCFTSKFMEETKN